MATKNESPNPEKDAGAQERSNGSPYNPYRDDEKKEQYDKGWNEADGQDDFNNNRRYNPPRDEEAKKSYDDGFNGAKNSNESKK